MSSFQDIAKGKEKDRLKFSKKGFSAPKNSNPRAIGGASPVSIKAIERLEALEENIGEDGSTLSTKLDSIDSTASTNTQNIASLDLANGLLGNQINTVAQALTVLESEVDTKAATNAILEHLNEAQVRALVTQMLAELAVTTVPMGNPTIAAGQYGADFTFTEKWGDDFLDADAETLFNRWHPDLMTDTLHQAGNDGREGWRWSAQYSQPKETSFIRNNSLHMRAKVDEVANPFRKAYVYRGETMNAQNYQIYLSFLSTWVLKNDSGVRTTDPDAPNRTWGPSTVFEFKMDLSEMRTQSCRQSIYLLPAYENDSNSYTPDGTIGVENDLTELDFLNGKENYSQSKVISSLAAGNTPAGSIDLNSIISALDLQEGEHTFTLLWAKDRFVWYVNGIEIQRDTDPRRIPQVPHYLVISREANSGIKAQRVDGVLFDDQDAYSDGSLLMPQDTGIWARPVYKEINQLHNDTARIVSFKSFSFVDNSTAGVGIGDDVSGISPTMISSNPPTVWTPTTTHQFVWDANSRVISDWYFELGWTRGGSELGKTSGTGDVTTASIQAGYAYNGPVNGRLWFRENANSVWHWRDFGFSSGLQPYRTGTDGKISVTVPVGTFTSSLPTVAGLGNLGVDLGTDGVYANTVDYTGGVVPVDYAEGFTPAITGTVGETPPTYTGAATLATMTSLTWSQYPNTTGELFWSQPSSGFEVGIDKYELVINNVIVYRGTGNSFFVEGYPEMTASATVRVVRDDGSFGSPRALGFSITTL